MFGVKEHFPFLLFHFNEFNDIKIYVKREIHSVRIVRTHYTHRYMYLNIYFYLMTDEHK